MANYNRATNPDDPWGRAKAAPMTELERLIRVIKSGPKSVPGVGGTFAGGNFFAGSGSASRFGGAPKPSSNRLTLDGIGRASDSVNSGIPLVGGVIGAARNAAVNASASKRGMDALKSIPAVGGLFGAISGIANAVQQNQGAGNAGDYGGGVGNYGAMPSFDEIMGQIQASMAGDAPDASAMAQSQFAPQFDLLSQLRSQTTGRMNQQAEDAQAMYDALASSIDADKSQVGKEYDTAAQNIDAAFSDAAASIDATGDKSNADANAIMQRLGITAAAPDVRGAIAEDQQRSANSIAEMQANYAGNNEANRQSALDYITSQANTAGLAGANARADVEAALANALSGYDNQELSLKGQQAAAENQYAMQIAGMQAEQQAAAMDQAWKQYQASVDQDRWQQEYDWKRQTDTWDNEIARAAEERALREMLEKGARGATDAAGKVDASTAMMREAAKYFPEEKANAVAYQIREAVAANPQIETLPQLLQAIKARFPGNKDAAIYSHLATIFGQQLGLK